MVENSPYNIGTNWICEVFLPEGIFKSVVEGEVKSPRQAAPQTENVT